MDGIAMRQQFELCKKGGPKVGHLFEVRFFSIVFAHLANSTGGDGGIRTLDAALHRILP